MTKKRNELIYVGHMYDMAQKISVRFKGLSREAFDGTEDLQIIAIHLMQTIGEAAERVTDSFRNNYP